MWDRIESITTRDWEQYQFLTALRAIALVEPFVAGKHLIESFVIKRASQLQHLVAIDHVPPSAASLHPHVADEFIGRLDST